MGDKNKWKKEEGKIQKEVEQQDKINNRRKENTRTTTKPQYTK